MKHAARSDMYSFFRRRSRQRHTAIATSAPPPPLFIKVRFIWWSLFHQKSDGTASPGCFFLLSYPRSLAPFEKSSTRWMRQLSMWSNATPGEAKVQWVKCALGWAAIWGTKFSSHIHWLSRPAHNISSTLLFSCVSRSRMGKFACQKNRTIIFAAVEMKR